MGIPKAETPRPAAAVVRRKLRRLGWLDGTFMEILGEEIWDGKNFESRSNTPSSLDLTFFAFFQISHPGERKRYVSFTNPP
jgi:hypothetical protein